MTIGIIGAGLVKTTRQVIYGSKANSEITSIYCANINPASDRWVRIYVNDKLRGRANLESGGGYVEVIDNEPLLLKANDFVAADAEEDNCIEFIVSGRENI